MYVSPVLALFGGHGNSFHGTGGRDNKLSQLRYTLRLLLSVCGGGGGGGGGEEWILQDLHEQGAIPLIIGNGEREGEEREKEGEERERVQYVHTCIHSFFSSIRFIEGHGVGPSHWFPWQPDHFRDRE